MRVAFTDRSSSAAAFAYQPGGTPANGDVWFEQEDNSGFDPTYQFGTNLVNYGSSSSTISKMGIGSEGYSFRSSIHEIGHAIGLSHPFDGSSFTGQTLSSSLDKMRNSVMSYTSFDRNRAVSFNTYADLTAANNGTVLNNYDYQNLDSISIAQATILAHPPTQFMPQPQWYMTLQRQTTCIIQAVLLVIQELEIIHINTLTKLLWPYIPSWMVAELTQ